MNESRASSPAEETPTAEVHVRRRSWAWLIPAAASLFAGWLGYQSLARRGQRITVRATEGHGLKAGDPLRYRGINAGAIESVRLLPDLEEVALDVRISPEAEAIARAGSRFWIVRPQLAIDSVQGLETVVGARYLAVLPGPADAEPLDEFVALEDPPVAEDIEAGGLEITLQAPARFGLVPGAPLTYRQIQIGALLSVGLSSDATAVECRAYVRPAFARLIRENTVFWETGGIEVDLDLMGGLRFEVESFRSLLIGGVAVGTPTSAGPPVNTGHRFALLAEPPADRSDWTPSLPVGSDLLPPGSPLPEFQRASLEWKTALIIERMHARQGWLLSIAEGVLGPSDLLRAAESHVEGSAVLEVAGERRSLPESPIWERGGLALLDMALVDAPLWPAELLRAPSEVEDCLIVADPGAPMALSRARLSPLEFGWKVDDALSLDPQWHGAGVVARTDGKLIGILLVEKNGARVAPLLLDW